ncbi:hypothetical protein [Halalkalibacter okhensis]|uniref:Uncharacterized protein n=1 Tax=Halalkalibacter okhensis TaxID=333138 RepID=A0A0B0IH87_9BACI|nr:hypothetical protein [Halalkalibacter okhensis]KHF40675.1 hypothetical protein LQ50_07680 [Halalkalibacter okhensis]
MYRGKAYCEANLYIYAPANERYEFLTKRKNIIEKYCSNTIKITDVRIKDSGIDEQTNEPFLSLSVMSEVLVKYDPIITHLNDYRVNACREFRRQFPGAGAIMAHYIDTYSPFRLDGFKSRT